MRIEKIKKWLLLSLIIILPYHHMVISVLLQNFGFLKYWKELVIMILFLITVFEVIKEKKWKKISVYEILLVAFIAFLFIYIAISDSKYRALYIARLYFMPILLVPVIKYMNLTKDDIKNVMKIVMVNTIIICVWGIFQAHILGDDFLIDLGYKTQRVKHMLKLKNEFYMFGGGFMQRLTSTFAAPNTCGMYLAIVLVFIIYLKKELELPDLLTKIAAVIITGSLILTFSRTSWIACAAAIALYYVKYIHWSLATWKKIIMFVIAGGIVFTILDIFVLKTGIMPASYCLVVNTLTGKDSSLIGHMDSIYYSIIKVSKHPMGLGLGNNGPRAMVFIKKPNLTESSYFLMAYETGLIGAFLYFMTYAYAIGDNIRTFKKNKTKELLVVRAVIIIMLVGYLSLPFIQDFELLVIMYMIISLQYNDTLIKDASYKKVF